MVSIALYPEWTILCTESLDAYGAKYSAGKVYRIKDKFPATNCNDEAYYEICGDIGMTQISHSVLRAYFDTKECVEE